jgi:hypothetical protein
VLEKLGATEEEITRAIVDHLVWVARTTARAGNRALSDELFAAAETRARIAPPGLLARVRLQRARLDREQGRRLAYLAGAVRAADARRAARR